MACSSSRVRAAVCTAVPLEDVAAEAAAAAAQEAAEAAAAAAKAATAAAELEEELAEERLQRAVEDFFKNNGVERGASYKNIARRHGVSCRELRDEVEVLGVLRWESEKYSDSD